MTEEQIVVLGDYCESLMRDDNFNQLCAIFRDQAFTAMMATKSADTLERESIYSEVSGLQKFLGLLGNFVRHGALIKSATDTDPLEFDDNTETDNS